MEIVKVNFFLTIVSHSSIELVLYKSLVNGDSCQDAIVEFGTNDTIVDTNNETWTIHSDGKIYKNGQLAGFSASVIELVY